jgi:hypothetical protein
LGGFLGWFDTGDAVKLDDAAVEPDLLVASASADLDETPDLLVVNAEQ